MKYLIFISLVLCSSAYAVETPVTSKPTCGKTVEECQKKVDDDQKQFDAIKDKAQKAINAYKQLLMEANDRLAAATAN